MPDDQPDEPRLLSIARLLDQAFRLGPGCLADAEVWWRRYTDDVTYLLRLGNLIETLAAQHGVTVPSMTLPPIPAPPAAEPDRYEWGDWEERLGVHIIDATPFTDDAALLTREEFARLYTGARVDATRAGHNHVMRVARGEA